MKEIDDFVGAYRFLSNFYPDGPGSVEHLFQAFKCANVADAVRIMKLETPGEAKKIGRAVEMRTCWEQNKIEVMYGLILSKFQDQTLRTMLINTGTAELIEGNTWGDDFWGTCNGIGRNELGKILMRVRKEVNYK
jgi:N-glycosidase YbiA